MFYLLIVRHRRQGVVFGEAGVLICQDYRKHSLIGCDQNTPTNVTCQHSNIKLYIKIITMWAPKYTSSLEDFIENLVICIILCVSYMLPSCLLMLSCFYFKQRILFTQYLFVGSNENKSTFKKGALLVQRWVSPKGIY